MSELPIWVPCVIVWVLIGWALWFDQAHELGIRYDEPHYLSGLIMFSIVGPFVLLMMLVLLILMVAELVAQTIAQRIQKK